MVKLNLIHNYPFIIRSVCNFLLATNCSLTIIMPGLHWWSPLASFISTVLKQPVTQQNKTTIFVSSCIKKKVQSVAITSPTVFTWWVSWELSRLNGGGGGRHWDSTGQLSPGDSYSTRPEADLTVLLAPQPGSGNAHVRPGSCAHAREWCAIERLNLRTQTHASVRIECPARL